MPQIFSGRYVRIYQIKPEWLSLAEVQVFSNGVNVARNGTASQTITGFGGTPDKAIDGNTDGNWNDGSVTHSGTNNAFNWWQVDLGATYNVDQIAIFNRTRCRVGRSPRYSNRVIPGMFHQPPARLDQALLQGGKDTAVQWKGSYVRGATAIRLASCGLIERCGLRPLTLAGPSSGPKNTPGVRCTRAVPSSCSSNGQPSRCAAAASAM